MSLLGIDVSSYRTVGGGSKSDRWIQICADVLGCAFSRPKVTEAGVLGAAILAGAGGGTYASLADGVAAVVRLDRQFEPNPQAQARYAERFAQYTRLWPLTKDYLRAIAP